MAPRVFAIAAHPDDIEFTMAGTLILLGRAGAGLHYMNIANGSCGSSILDAETIAAIRLSEARAAAGSIGATFYPPLVSDIEILYERGLLASLASIVRDVAPDILLVPSPQDYMEDHMNACRLAVTAAFCRGMPNYPVVPPRPPVDQPVTIYHAQPYGNRDGLDRLVRPDFVVDIGSVIDEKAAMLAQHRSQKEWLDRSQGLDAYLETMREHARQVGELSGRFELAEGWRRHNPLGLCSPGADPLGKLLGDRVARLG
jgi:LmbE family N-acetylglucosaminyl deacetylase